MKKLLIPVLLVLLPFVTAELQPVDCFDYYDFGAVDINVQPERFAYSPGDSVYFTGTATNNNPHPITEGKVRVQILYQEGPSVEYMLHEFFAAEGMYLGPGEAGEFGGYWEIPENAKAGRYIIEVYFTVDEFNLAGVSFLRGLPGDLSSFEVEGGTDLVYIDIQNIKVNEEAVVLREYQPVQQEGLIKVEVPLKNIGAATEAEVTYKLYAWDDLREDFLVDTRTETVSLGADGESLLTYEKSLNTGAYLLRIKAEAKNNAILKLRIPVGGERVKLNYLGVDKFPIKKGDQVKVFLCASNSADYENSVSSYLSVALEDDKGAIFSDLTSADVTPNIDGFLTTFMAERDIYSMKLTAVASDEEGNEEEVELAYDRSEEAPKLRSVKPKPSVTIPEPPPEREKPGDNTLLILLIAVIIGLGAFVYIKNRK
jgi:hypothetical protein